MTLQAVPCPVCTKDFTPKRAWQRYCSRGCKRAFERAQYIDRAAMPLAHMRGVICSVRTLQRGVVSVVVRFGLDARQDALELMPGHLVAIERIEPPAQPPAVEEGARA